MDSLTDNETLVWPTLWCGAVRNPSRSNKSTYTTPVRRYVLPASSWARYRRKDGSIRPAYLPDEIQGCLVDPGAFVASQKGRYTYDFFDYLRWLFSFKEGQVALAGMMDYCCVNVLKEPPLPDKPCHIYQVLAHGDPVRERQLKTMAMAMDIYNCHLDVPWIWFPTLHGLSVSQYIAHAVEMRDLILRLKWCYGPDSLFRVGIGSLCRPMRPGELTEIIDAVSGVLPGVNFHLWGVDLRVLQSLRCALPPCVVSCDTSNWNGRAFCRKLSTLSPEKPSVSQMEQAYSNLPKYERSVQNALRRVRPALLPGLWDYHSYGVEDPKDDITIREIYDMFVRMIEDAAAQHPPLPPLSFPDDYLGHFTRTPNANEFFIPWM